MLALPLLLAAVLVAVARGVDVPCETGGDNGGAVADAPTGCKMCDTTSTPTVCTECSAKDSNGENLYLTETADATKKNKCMTATGCKAAGGFAAPATTTPTDTPAKCHICENGKAYKEGAGCVVFGTGNGADPDCRYYVVEDGVRVCEASCETAEGGAAGGDGKCTYSCSDKVLRNKHCKVCGGGECTECMSEVTVGGQKQSFFLNKVDRDAEICLTSGECTDLEAIRTPVAEDGVCRVPPSKCINIENYPNAACAGPVIADACYGIIGCDGCGVDVDEKKAYCLHCAYGTLDNETGRCNFASDCRTNVKGCRTCQTTQSEDGKNKYTDWFICEECNTGYDPDPESGLCVFKNTPEGCQIYDQTASKCRLCKAGLVLIPGTGGAADECEEPTVDTEVGNCKHYQGAKSCMVCDTGYFPTSNGGECKEATDVNSECTPASGNCEECGAGGSNKGVCKLPPEGYGFSGNAYAECTYSSKCVNPNDNAAFGKACNSGYEAWPDMDGQTVTCQEVSSNSCPEGTRLDTGDEPGCVACKLANCKQCTLDTKDKTKETCSSCLDGYDWSTDKTTCVKRPEGCKTKADKDGNCPASSCMEGYYAEKVTATGAKCKSCSSLGEGCTACKLEKDGPVCTGCDAEKGYWFDSKAKECNQCGDNKMCKRGGSCGADKDCTACLDGFYPDKGGCVECDVANCAFCSQAKQCGTCAVGYDFEYAFGVNHKATKTGSCVEAPVGCGQGHAYPGYVMNAYGIPESLEILCESCQDGSYVGTKTEGGLYTTKCSAPGGDEDSGNGGGDGLSPGAIAGIVIAVLVVVAAVVLGCVFGLKACKNKKGSQGGNEQALQPISS